MAFGRKLRKGAIDSSRILDSAILKADLKASLSAEQTGTGASQNVAHGLGTTPSLVLIIITESPATYAALDVTEGTHDATNVVVTVSVNWKFKAFAMA